MLASLDNYDFASLRAHAGLTMPELVEMLGVSERTLYRWERGETAPKKGIINLIQKGIEQKNQSDAQSNFTFIDLFAGIGGLRRGFELIGGKCVFTSEWDKYAQMTYKANYPCGHNVAGDITKIAAEEIPRHDVLLAGFPCQPFSIAGVSKKNSLGKLHGFRCEAQGTLFFDVARIIEHHRPKAFLLENVKNLASHNQGKTFEVIYRTLTEELGYHVDYKIINGKSFVPQNRERIFIAGFRENCSFSFNDLYIPNPNDGPVLSSILHPEDGSEISETPFTEGKDAKVSEKYTLSNHLWSYLQSYAEKHRAKGNGFGFGLCAPNDVARTLSARYYKDGSEILISRGKKKNPRRLTPRECARLMGFDRCGQSEFKIPVSDTQAYKQFGNAVIVPVVEAVARHLQTFILKKR